MMVYNMKSLTLFLLLLLSTNFAQKIDTVSVVMNSVKTGEKNVDQSEWKNLSFSKGIPLAIEFALSSEVKKQVFYKVFLDGTLIRAHLSEKNLILNELATGTHVLKIAPATMLGDEGIPLLLSFSVGEEKNIAPPKTEAPKNDSASSVDVKFLLPALVTVQFVIIIVLLIFRKKSTAVVNQTTTKSKYSEKQNESVEEILRLKQKLLSAKEDLNIHKQTIENLKAQLHDVNANVQDLERANLHLIDQKMKLEQSKYKLELLHSQKEEMFAVAIHDIKNPASAIRGYIDLLNSFDLNAVEQQEIMVSLVATSDDIVKMSQQMCTILAKAMPEPSLNYAKHTINDIIETVVNQNTSYSKTKKVKIVKNISEDLPELTIDTEKIEEALDNLLNNAIKFAPPDTIVEVSTFLKNDKKKTVAVAVKDNGVGLSEEDLRRSFQKGAMLSAKPTGLEQSSGLGLWIVKKIIEEHNGKVWVESKIGIGSTFGFELPAE